MLLKKNIFSCLAFLFLLSVSHAQNNVYLSLSSAGKKRSDIAIDNFTASDRNANSIKYAKLFKDVIENDLILSRYFNIMREASEYIGDNISEKLSYFAKAGSAVLLSASVSSSNEDSISIEITMFDVESGGVIWSEKHKGNVSDYRYIAHEASDEIVKRFIGDTGIARTKIVFVNNCTKHKELYVIDYDGYNIRRLTRDDKINILPRWSPVGDKIIYTSYLYNNPDLFYLDIVKNRRGIISKYQGLNATGVFSPDGGAILLTLSRGNFPNLYLINASGGILQKLTAGSCIDTSPSFAPNGQEIVFISDRFGYPQLYIMNVAGGNVKRLSTNGFCDSPSWSPRGDKIVFTMRRGKSNYDLYIYDLPTAKITRLTDQQGKNENPSWSPDGRFVAFCSNRSGKGEIYIMAIDGSGTRKLTEIPGNSYTPAWSPVLAK
ncbi:MAG: Tol-Pal system beta propeller repeat protein TolB [Endomicrobium sp.]|nr:Tol-Pal system beta propeller repeat protein TolB [Endomicrobium sp.]